jgi:hypothetical protein
MSEEEEKEARSILEEMPNSLSLTLSSSKKTKKICQ